MIFKIILVGTICLQGVRSGCEEEKETIAKIKSAWNGNPPANVFQRLSNTWFVLRSNAELKTRGLTIYHLKNTIYAHESRWKNQLMIQGNAPTVTLTFEYQHLEEGVVLKKLNSAEGVLEYEMYMLYMDDEVGVQANWTCGRKLSSKPIVETWIREAVVHGKRRRGDFTREELAAIQRYAPEAIERAGLKIPPPLSYAYAFWH